MAVAFRLLSLSAVVTIALLSLLLLLSSLPQRVDAGTAMLEHLSLTPPYDDVDYNGERLPGKGFRSSGTTVVNSNFIRLTPDRQSKKGALWSKAAVGMNSVFGNLKFRISGQGKNFFGDGIALWIVQNSFYVEGDLHGFQEKFVGVGIIFDTFKNTETLSVHRDITIIVNDGERTREAMFADVQGCNANFRYHNERADFKVTDNAVAHLEIIGNRLILKVDPKGTGEFMDCVEVPDVGLKEGWLKRSYVGITASTGQLADNHDIVSLSIFDNAQSLIDLETNPKSERLETLKGAPNEVRITNLEKKMNEVMDKQAYNDHQIEHDLVEASGRIENLLSKYKTQIEQSNSGASNDVALIESTVKKEVGSSLDSRLTVFQKDMSTFVDKQIFDASSRVDSISSFDPPGFKSRLPFNAKPKNSRRPATPVAAPVQPCSCVTWTLYLSVILTVAVLGNLYSQSRWKIPYYNM